MSSERPFSVNVPLPGHEADPDDGFLAAAHGLHRAVDCDRQHDGGDHLGRLVGRGFLVEDLDGLGDVFGQLEFFLDGSFGVLAH